MLECRGGKRLMGVEELTFVTLVRRLGDESAVAPPTQRGRRFGCQPVDRQVRRLERQRRGNVGGPAAGHLVRQREDQVERDVIDAPGARVLDGGANRSCIVRAMHPSQNIIVERLCANRKPVHARGSPRVYGLPRYILRIGLDGDFRAGVDREARPQDLQQLSNPGTA